MQQIIKALILLAPVCALIAVGPIEVSPNTENSPSVYLFPFKLSKALPNSGYLLVTFPNYQTAVTPTSCKLVNTSFALACTNFQSPTLSFGVTSALLATVNPNISPMLTVIVDSDAALAANTNYYLQVVLTNVIPSTASLSDSFELYSVSYNGIVYEQNWNFGQVEFLSRQTNVLAVSNLSSLAAVMPGTTSILQIDINVGVNVASTLPLTQPPTPASRSCCRTPSPSSCRRSSPPPTTRCTRPPTAAASTSPRRSSGA